MIHKIDYVGPDYNVIRAEIEADNEYKIPEQAINKALMIAMNYLIENIETEEHESAE